MRAEVDRRGSDPAIHQQSAAASAALLTRRQRSAALAIVACAMVLDLVDMTIINVAVPTLQAQLRASDAEVQWMVAGYSTIFALLLVSGGRLGDMIGYRRAFLIGVAGFTLTSLLCGIAQTPGQLVLGRLLQGGAAAIMLPQVMSLTQIMYPPAERVSALALFGILGGLAAVLGPVIGGFLLSANLFGLGWRPIFLVNLPIGVMALLLAARILPAGRSAASPKLDLPGTGLVLALLFALVFPLIQGRDYGWPAWGFVLMGSSVPIAFILMRYSRTRMERDGSALIVPALFRARSFSFGLLTTLLFQTATGGLMFTLTLAMQRGLGFTAAQVGIAHVPYAVGASFAIGMLSRKALPRYGPIIISWGAVLMIAGLAALTAFFRADGLAAIAPPLIALPLLVMGLGMGLTGGPLPPCALSEVDVDHAGAASGMIKATQQLGAAVGTAAIGTLFFVFQPERDMARADAIEAFVLAAGVIGTLLFLTALLALFIPRNLQIRGRIASA
jgi:EmrB/QacA subfamily drug resistance transporter